MTCLPSSLQGQSRTTEHPHAPEQCSNSSLRRNEATKDATEGCDEAVEAANKGEKVAEDHQSQGKQHAGTSDKHHVS